MKVLTRRTILAATALAGCARRSGPTHPVSVYKAPHYNIDLTQLMRTAIREHGLTVTGKNIVLKPNLVEFDPTTPINTNSLFVRAAYEAFIAEGAATVRIGEGPGHRRPTMDLASATGYFDAITDFENRFTDLNWADVQRVDIPSPESGLKELYLPKIVLNCDLLVSLPKMKTHHWVGATLSMKNFFGLAPGAVYGWPKNPLHWAGIPEVIRDLQKLVPPTFAFVDGIQGMEGNGPIQGVPKHAGLIVAGAHLPSVDTTCCRIMGIDPEQIPYLGSPLPDIEHRGERPETVRTDFALIPEHAGLRLARS